MNSTRRLAQRFAAALVDAYRPAPGVLARVGVYADAARVRLACVYALRPRWAASVPAALLHEVGRPVDGLGQPGGASSR